MIIPLQLNGWNLLIFLLNIGTFAIFATSDTQILIFLHVLQLLHDRATLLAISVEVKILVAYYNVALFVRQDHVLEFYSRVQGLVLELCGILRPSLGNGQFVW